MCIKNKQIFKDHITHVYFNIFFFSRFRLKLHFLCLFVFLLFSLLRFDFTIYFYILVLYSVFGKNKLGISIIDQTRKTAFTEEFLTAANTLYRFEL